MELDDWNDVGEGILLWGLAPRYYGKDFYIDLGYIRGELANSMESVAGYYFALYPIEHLSKLPPDQQRERMETLLVLCQIKYGKAG